MMTVNLKNSLYKGREILNTTAFQVSVQEGILAAITIANEDDLFIWWPRN